MLHLFIQSAEHLGQKEMSRVCLCFCFLYIQRGTPRKPTQACARCISTGLQPTRRQFLRKEAFAAYANCAGTLFRPTRLRALQKRHCSDAGLNLQRSWGGVLAGKSHALSSAKTRLLQRPPRRALRLEGWQSRPQKSGYGKGGDFPFYQTCKKSPQPQAI